MQFLHKLATFLHMKPIYFLEIMKEISDNPLTPAEKQERYRLRKLDTERNEENSKKDRDRWNRNLKERSIEIKFSNVQQSRKRKYWRVKQR